MPEYWKRPSGLPVARIAWYEYSKEITVESIDWEEDELTMTRVEISTVKSRHVTTRFTKACP